MVLNPGHTGITDTLINLKVFVDSGVGYRHSTPTQHKAQCDLFSTGGRACTQRGRSVGRSRPRRGGDRLGSFSEKYGFALETGGNSVPDGAQHVHTPRV